MVARCEERGTRPSHWSKVEFDSRRPAGPDADCSSIVYVVVLCCLCILLAAGG